MTGTIAQEGPYAMTSSPLSEIRDEFNARGYVTMAGRLSTAEIDAVKDQLHKLANEKAGSDSALDTRSGVLFQLYDVPRRRPPLGNLPAHPHIVKGVKLILQVDVAIGWALMLNKANEPDSNWFIPWHQDTSIYCAEPPAGMATDTRGGFQTFRTTDDAIAQLIVARLAIDRDSRASGCLYVIPGSHKLGNSWPDGAREFDNQAGVAVELEPGEVMLYSPLIMHRAERSQADAQRRVIHMYYRPTDMSLPAGGQWITW